MSSAIAEAQFGGIGGPPVRMITECVPFAPAAFFVFHADRVVDLVGRQRLAAY